jgi:hypothetical protein
MGRSDISNWKRRGVLKATAVATTGGLALGPTTAAAQEDANVSVTFSDQESDGTSVVIASLRTDVDAEVIVFESEGDRTRYRVLEVDAGTEFTDRTVELDTPIPESQLISVSVQPPEGSFSYGGARATVAVGESLTEARFGERIELVEADSEAGFNWPYLLRTPETPDAGGDGANADGTETRPLVVGNSPWRGVPSETERRLDSGLRHLKNGRLDTITTELNAPGLVALLPARTEDGSYDNIRLSESGFDRLDRQLLAMVADARERLAEQPYDVPEKLHVEGFSNNGRFFDQFAILHPERVNALSAGGNGVVVLPFAELTDEVPTAGEPSTTTVRWPVGVADLPELVGAEFDREAWLETDQYWYIGAEDQGPDDPEGYVHKLYRGSGYPDDLIQEIFGSVQVDDRFRTSQAIFEQVGASATFTAYDGAGHEVTEEMTADVTEFHRQQKHEEFGPQFARTVAWPDGTVAVDEPISVRATYENLGATDATTTATLVVDGEPRSTREVDVAPGESEPVEFELSFDAPGEYPVSLDGTDTASIEVASAETETDTADGSGTTDGASTEAGTTATEQPGFGLIHALAAAGGAGYFLGRRTDDE